METFFNERLTALLVGKLAEKINFDNAGNVGIPDRCSSNLEIGMGLGNFNEIF